MIETAQDFTDSAYTSHENRERILILCERVRQELTILLRVGASLVCLLYWNTYYYGLRRKHMKIIVRLPIALTRNIKKSHFGLQLSFYEL